MHVHLYVSLSVRVDNYKDYVRICIRFSKSAGYGPGTKSLYSECDLPGWGGTPWDLHVPFELELGMLFPRGDVDILKQFYCAPPILAGDYRIVVAFVIVGDMCSSERPFGNCDCYYAPPIMGGGIK